MKRIMTEGRDDGCKEKKGKKEERKEKGQTARNEGR